MRANIMLTCKAALVALCVVPVAGMAKPGDLYVYPAKGQSNEQLEKDRYECYVWASKATGFDPTNASTEPQARVVRVPVQNEKQGAALAGTVIGAIAGAAIGAGDRHDHGQAAVAGAAVGTMIGATVEQQGQIKAEQEAKEQAAEIAKQQQDKADGMSNYRRAFSACLEGRGYVVK